MAGDVMGRVTPSPILFQEQIGCYSNPTHFIFRNGLTFRPPVEKNETLLQIIFAVVGAGMAAAVYLGLYDNDDMDDPSIHPSRVVANERIKRHVPPSSIALLSSSHFHAQRPKDAHCHVDRSTTWILAPMHACKGAGDGDVHATHRPTSHAFVNARWTMRTNRCSPKMRASPAGF
jgi:hypothetical protein